MTHDAAAQSSATWLVVVDPQRIFADPTSDWASPDFDAAFANISQLATAFAGRVIITRWLPTASRESSWGAYFEQWPFADVPPTDALYDLVPQAEALVERPTVDEPTFGKWDEQLRAIVGDRPRLVVTGVSTDCCVITTALAAADAGAWVLVPTDAVAHSTPENGAAALHTMSLFAPQLQLTTTADILAVHNQ